MVQPAHHLPHGIQILRHVVQVKAADLRLLPHRCHSRLPGVLPLLPASRHHLADGSGGLGFADVDGPVQGELLVQLALPLPEDGRLAPSSGCVAPCSSARSGTAADPLEPFYPAPSSPISSRGGQRCQGCCKALCSWGHGVTAWWLPQRARCRAGRWEPHGARQSRQRDGARQCLMPQRESTPAGAQPVASPGHGAWT